jgi:RimJ/RimL family protein N-acetyltransferase
VKPPPYRIETERLVIRCWNPSDAPLLRSAIDTSIDHLRAWMVWATREPVSLEETVERLRLFRGEFDLGRNFVYGIFTADESEVVGGTGLNTRAGLRALEIGYWIRTGRTRNGFATEATAALTKAAFACCDIDRVEIRAEPGNELSRKIPNKLGFVEEATLRRRMPTAEEGGLRDVVVYSMFADRLEQSPCASAKLRAFDAGGGRLP